MATCLGLLVNIGMSRAEDNDAEMRRLADQQSRQIEQQRQQLEKLRQRVVAVEAAAQSAGGGTVDDNSVKKIVSQYLDEQDQKKKEDDAKAKKQAETEGYRIGTILGIQGRFNENGEPWFSTPNKDFTMHIGAWMQYDNVFWTQSPGLRTLPDGRPGHAQGVASGVAQGGIGDLEDGTFFRRIRPFVEGTFWENYEYRLVLGLENDQYSTAGINDFWVAVNNVPFIGTIRVGHLRNAMGFEAGMTVSERSGTLMERSSYSEAIEENQNFVTGIWFHNNYFDQRATLAATAFRTDNAQASGAFFGDGQWGSQSRLTFLPVYKADGRCWLHLGISGGWRNGQNNIATSPDRLFQLRARPELRDDDPAGSPAGGQIIPNANSNRMVDIGPIAAHDQFLMGLEMCWVRGPFSIQAEYGWNWLDRAYGVAPTGYTLNPAIVPESNYVFNGGYVQLAYTLTGESRAYDRSRGGLSRYYFNRGPNTPAWLVRNENGNFSWGWGAWELAGRFSYIDLNDGSGLNRIQGGIMEGFTVGLNWYLNSNLRCLFDWVYNHRDDVPVGTIPGWTSGFGMRAQLEF
jgi:phosphate-selective porin OprO/OprP